MIKNLKNINTKRDANDRIEGSKLTSLLREYYTENKEAIKQAKHELDKNTTITGIGEKAIKITIERNLEDATFFIKYEELAVIINRLLTGNEIGNIEEPDHMESLMWKKYRIYDHLAIITTAKMAEQINNIMTSKQHKITQNEITYLTNGETDEFKFTNEQITEFADNLALCKCYTRQETINEEDFRESIAYKCEDVTGTATQEEIKRVQDKAVLILIERGYRFDKTRPVDILGEQEITEENTNLDNIFFREYSEKGTDNNTNIHNDNSIRTVCKILNNKDNYVDLTQTKPEGFAVLQYEKIIQQIKEDKQTEHAETILKNLEETNCIIIINKERKLIQANNNNNNNSNDDKTRRRKQYATKKTREQYTIYKTIILTNICKKADKPDANLEDIEEHALKQYTTDRKTDYYTPEVDPRGGTVFVHTKGRIWIINPTFTQECMQKLEKQSKNIEYDGEKYHGFTVPYTDEIWEVIDPNLLETMIIVTSERTDLIQQNPKLYKGCGYYVTRRTDILPLEFELMTTTE